MKSDGSHRIFPMCYYLHDQFTLQVTEIAEKAKHYLLSIWELYLEPGDIFLDN